MATDVAQRRTVRRIDNTHTHLCVESRLNHQNLLLLFMALVVAASVVAWYLNEQVQTNARHTKEIRYNAWVSCTTAHRNQMALNRLIDNIVVTLKSDQLPTSTQAGELRALESTKLRVIVCPPEPAKP